MYHESKFPFASVKTNKEFSFRLNIFCSTSLDLVDARDKHILSIPRVPRLETDDWLTQPVPRVLQRQFATSREKKNTRQKKNWQRKERPGEDR